MVVQAGGERSGKHPHAPLLPPYLAKEKASPAGAAEARSVHKDKAPSLREGALGDLRTIILHFDPRIRLLLCQLLLLTSHGRLLLLLECLLWTASWAGVEALWDFCDLLN